MYPRLLEWLTGSRVLVVTAIVALGAAAVSGPPAPTLAAVEDSPTVVAVPLGAWVGAAGVAAGAGAVWIANGSRGTVSRLDPQTTQVVATIPIAEPAATCERCWGAVAARGEAVWAAMDAAGPVVVRIDPSSNRVASSVTVGVQPKVLAVDEDGAVWLAAPLENAVVRVESRRGTVDARIAVDLPIDLAVDTRALWATRRRAAGADGQVVHIDPRTAEVGAAIAVGHQPGALAVDESGVWVANELDDTVSRIEPRTNSVVATIPVVPRPVGIAIGAGAVWVVSRGFSVLSEPAVSRIDPGTNTLAEATSLAGKAPQSMVAGEGSLWVLSHDPDELVRFGPVPLSANTAPAGRPPLRSIALGGTVLLLAAGLARRRAAHRDDARPASTGQLLSALLQHKQQAGPRVDSHQ